MKAKFNPACPRSFTGVKSVSLGRLSYRVTARLLADAPGATAARRRTRSPFFGPVWNIIARPPPPRASRLIVTPMRAAIGSAAAPGAKMARAPTRPNSSASVNSSTRSRACVACGMARATSSAAATPAISSAAPCEAHTESWWASSATAGAAASLPARTATRLMAGAAGLPPHFASRCAGFSASGVTTRRVVKPSSASRRSISAMAARLAGVPVGCGSRASTRTSAMARPALN